MRTFILGFTNEGNHEEEKFYELSLKEDPHQSNINTLYAMSFLCDRLRDTGKLQRYHQICALVSQDQAQKNWIKHVAENPNWTHEEFYEFFNTYNPDRANEISQILSGKNVCFGDFHHDAYINWNKLTAVHKDCTRKANPVHFRNLKAFADSQYFVLKHSNEIFTGETVKIIHGFLYQL